MTPSFSCGKRAIRESPLRTCYGPRLAGTGPSSTICHSEERSDEESREQKCALLTTGSFAFAQDDRWFLLRSYTDIGGSRKKAAAFKKTPAKMARCGASQRAGKEDSGARLPDGSFFQFIFQRFKPKTQGLLPVAVAGEHKAAAFLADIVPQSY